MESSSCKIFQLCLLLIFVQTGLAIFCSQCSSEKSSSCESNPPPATNCTHCLQMDEESKRCIEYKEYEYCITLTKFVNETKTSFTRACNPLYMSDNCSYGKEDVKNVKFCYTNCNTDGCNTAAPSGGGTWHGPITLSVALFSLNLYMQNV